jgi:hypothetical protein
MGNGESIPRLVLGDFSRAWPKLVATDLTYKAAAFVILAPLSAVILQLLLRFSGQEALSDQDILYFALKPLGWVTLIVVGSIVVGIVALELAALMLIGFGATEGRDVQKGSRHPDSDGPHGRSDIADWSAVSPCHRRDLLLPADQP